MQIAISSDESSTSFDACASCPAANARPSVVLWIASATTSAVANLVVSPIAPRPLLAAGNPTGSNRFNFTITGERKNYYSNPIEDAYVMELDVSH